MKQRHPGYDIAQYNIIIDVLWGRSKAVDATLQKLVGNWAKDVKGVPLRKYCSHA